VIRRSFAITVIRAHRPRHSLQVSNYYLLLLLQRANFTAASAHQCCSSIQGGHHILNLVLQQSAQK
jgi:hypothetical protein